MLHGMETVAVTERQVGKNESYRVENGEMATWSDKRGQDKKRERDSENREARRQTSECKATLLWAHEKERRLRGKRMMEMVVSGTRKRGRPRKKWMDLEREDMERVRAKEGDEVDRVKWKILSRCGDPE